MKARRKIIRAGMLWVGLQYRSVHSRDPSTQRQAKAQISTPIKETINAKQSFYKLMLQIACNFLPSDSCVTLTYRPDCLPRTKTEADKYLTAFIRAYRAALRERGTAALPYIRVTEGYHAGDRFHHHVILPRCSADKKMILEHWGRYGDIVDVRPLSWGPPDRYEDGRPKTGRPRHLPDNCYFSWAHYLTKEPREKGRAYVGERMWRASLGMAKPTIIYNNVSEDDPLQPPPGGFVTDRDESINCYGRFVLITALVPESTTK